jgi:hypothetical protein
MEPLTDRANHSGSAPEPRSPCVASPVRTHPHRTALGGARAHPWRSTCRVWPEVVILGRRSGCLARGVLVVKAVVPDGMLSLKAIWIGRLRGVGAYVLQNRVQRGAKWSEVAGCLGEEHPALQPASSRRLVDWRAIAREEQIWRTV